MISNHYAMTYGHKYNWLILIAITLIGALVRIYFVARHKGKASLIPLFLALAVLAAIVTAIAPRNANTLSINSSANIDVAAVHHIVIERCSSCHSKSPSQPGFQSPPKGVVLETVQDITQHATAIYQQTVVTKAMPIGNLTGITDEERNAIDLWYLQNR